MVIHIYIYIYVYVSKYRWQTKKKQKNMRLQPVHIKKNNQILILIYTIFHFIYLPGVIFQCCFLHYLYSLTFLSALLQSLCYFYFLQHYFTPPLAKLNLTVWNWLFAHYSVPVLPSIYGTGHRYCSAMLINNWQMGCPSR